jgi:antitoxin component of MazEF toxin-antitoxin module
MRIGKRGSSLAVRIPKAVVREMDLSEGDDVKLVLIREGVLAVVRAPVEPDKGSPDSEAT